MQTQEGNFANIISDHKSDEENRRELIDDFNPDLERGERGSISYWGRATLEARIRRQTPALLGDIVLILPRTADFYSGFEATVIKILPAQVYLQTRLGNIIRRKRTNLWVITNQDIRPPERDQFPIGYEPDINYLPPPARFDVNDLYFDRLRAESFIFEHFE